MTLSMDTEGEELVTERDGNPKQPSDKEFLALSEDEQLRLIEYHQAIAESEHGKSRRILFERAQKESLPFLVYCIFVASEAIVATYIVTTQSEFQLAYYSIIMASMILPLFALPKNSISETIQWIKGVITG